MTTHAHINAGVPEGLSLFPYQRAGVHMMRAFLNSPLKGCYLADEMGLGKTIQIIVLCNLMKFRRITVICPKVVVPVWKEEILKWGSQHNEHLFYVTHYESARDRPEQFDGVELDCLVLDEVHRLKNRRAQVTKTVLTDIWPRSTYHICASGTPFTNQVTDLWTLLNKFMPDNFPDFYLFANEFSYKKSTPWGIKYEGLKNPDLLRRVMRSRLYVRRLKQDVLPELPAKQFQKILVPDIVEKLSKEEQKEQDEYIASIRAFFAHASRRPPVAPKSHVSRHRKEGLKKVPIIVSFLKDLLDNNIPVVVFTWFRDTLHAFNQELKEYSPAIITGDTSTEKRVESVKNFQGGQTDIFLATMASGGVGLTLTRSSTVVLAELDYVPATVVQAIDRVHRIGQKEHVMVYYFVGEHSVDEEVCDALIDKMKTFRTVLDAGHEESLGA